MNNSDPDAPHMTAVLAHATGGPETVGPACVPVPEPGPHQVRIRVAAAALNPIDLSARAGRLAAAGLLARTADIPLGWDVAGHIDRTGSDVRRFVVRQPVIGLRDVLSAGGTHADYVVLDATAVSPAPRSVPLEVAATLPLVGLTADRSLELTAAHAGDVVLVTGAAGGVGRLVVQLAAQRHIRTVAVARPGDVDELHRLGADDVLDSTEGLAERVRALVPGGVDGVVDAAVVGIDAHDALRSGGTFVALVRPFAPPPLRGTTVVVQEVHADGARLAELAALVDFGLLELPRSLQCPSATPPGRTPWPSSAAAATESSWFPTAKRMPTTGTQRASSLPVRHVNDRGPPPTCRLARWGSRVRADSRCAGARRQMRGITVRRRSRFGGPAGQCGWLQRSRLRTPSPSVLLQRSSR